MFKLYLKQMKYGIGLLSFILWISPVYAEWTAVYGNGQQVFSLATASPGELGLLKKLVERFTTQADATLQWRKAGSGASLKLLKEQVVDMVMVHAPAAEKQAVVEGWATNRRLIGSNEFYLVGPTADPAQIAQATSAVEAYTRIAQAKAPFLSRGDNSGTHKREMKIWQQAALEPKGDWYRITHDFMGATLKKANDQQGYFMTDSSTWIAYKKDLPQLKLLFKGDPILVNVYHALTAPEGTTPGQALAVKFVEFVASKEGQQIITEFGQADYGSAIYNNADYVKAYDH